jgi:hypothetical protein
VLYVLDDWIWALLVPLRVIEQKKDREGNCRVDRSANKLVAPIDVEVRESKESTVNEEEQETVDKKEAEVDENTGREIFYVDLDPDAGCNVTDDRLRHTVNANWLGGEGVLEEANSCSGQSASDGIAARDGKEDSDDQREIKDGKPRKGPREQRLQEDGTQRNQQGDGRGKAVLL